MVPLTSGLPALGKNNYIEAMRQIAEFVAVLACSLFTGASVYINLVEHPARMECGVEIAARQLRDL